MTAILTKQNARDKAFVGGNNSPTINGEFETIRVKGDSIFDGEITSPKLAVLGESVVNHETQIKAKKETPANGLPFEDDLNDFIINASTLTTLETDDYNILDITFNDTTDYDGNVFQLIFPTSMNLSNGIISISNGKFNNPRITFRIIITNKQQCLSNCFIWTYNAWNQRRLIKTNTANQCYSFNCSINSIVIFKFIRIFWNNKY